MLWDANSCRTTRWPSYFCRKKEFGHARLKLLEESKLFEGISKNTNVWMSHGDQVQDLLIILKLSTLTETAPVAACNMIIRIFLLCNFIQVTHTDEGIKVIDNFLFSICKASPAWNMDDLIENRINEIKERVGESKVLLGLSGGVDSSVTAILLHKAIGKKLICVFVDNGLFRKNEAEEVMDVFKANMDLNVIKSDAQDTFLRHLKGISDPGKKKL